jgi:hypothetical protein
VDRRAGAGGARGGSPFFSRACGLFRTRSRPRRRCLVGRFRVDADVHYQPPKKCRPEAGLLHEKSVQRTEALVARDTEAGRLDGPRVRSAASHTPPMSSTPSAHRTRAKAPAQLRGSAQFTQRPTTRSSKNQRAGNRMRAMRALNRGVSRSASKRGSMLTDTRVESCSRYARSSSDSASVLRPSAV